MKPKNILLGLVLLINLIVVMFLTIFLLLSFSFSDMTGWEKIILAQRDSFYVGSEDDQSIRIPLAKPYDVHTFSHSVEEGTWGIDLNLDHKSSTDPLNNYIVSVSGVKKIAVENDLVMVYAISYKEYDHVVPDRWVVIIPVQKIEKGFLKEKDFLEYIHNYGVDNPHWETITDAYQQFKNTGCLDWIPDCLN